ncbi:MAG: hypothetical protein SFU87_08905, partial [Chitinophagaceae bacterium]|nr:hypothetical protein [Chitinophagaceae bacterium]
MKHILFVILLITCSYRVFTQDTVRVQQNELVELQSAIIRHSHKDTIRVHMLTDYANLCFYNLDFLNGFKALSEARIISKQLRFAKGEGLYLKSISIFRRRINAGNAYIKTQNITKMNEVGEFINGLDIYYEVEGNGVLGRFTDFDIFGNINMPIGIRDSEIETMISKLEEALSYYAEKENVEITAYLQDALSFIYFNSDKEKSKKHKKVAQSLYQQLKWSYHQLFILANDINDLLGQGMEAEAKPLEIEAISIYTHEADKYIKAHCAYLLSRTYGIHNRVNLQLEYLFQAEDLLTEIGEKDLLKPVYISVAIVYEWYLTNSEKALEYEYKELNLRKEINHYNRLANTYLLISESLFGLKRIQDFPPEYKDYLKVGGIKGSLFFDAELLWVKARMLQAQGKSEEAQSVFQESITAYLKYNDKHGSSWAAFDLAESYKSVGDLKNAFKYAHKSFDWASDVNLLPKMIHSAGLLSQLYEQSGNKSKAFFYLKIYREAKEKEERLNNAANRSELEIQAVLKKRQQEIELLETESQLKEQENKTQRVWLFSIAGALVSLVFLSFILVRNNRQKQKANLVLNSKNRELEIETALERVRSASMAMHKSDELKQVVEVLTNQFRMLNSNTVTCWIALVNVETNTMEIWNHTDMDSPKSNYTVNGKDFHTFQSDIDAFKNKERFRQFSFEKEAAKRILKEQLEFDLVVPEESTDYHLLQYRHNFGFIGYASWSEPDEQGHSLLQRFAKVFEQTYTRFLDLQKAEAQAREMQIELSLERIRAKAMAMHDSGELSDVLTILFEQFDVLGICPVHAHLSLVNPDGNSITFRMTGKAGHRVSTRQIVTVDSWNQLKELIEVFIKSEPGYVQTLHFPKEAVLQLWKIFDEIISTIPEEFRPLPEDFPNGMYATEGYCKFGFIGFQHYREATEEEKEIVRKFATEFGRVYQRFLDLQKAESQAREAQIEAALERIRARSMAMHKSEELA